MYINEIFNSLRENISLLTLIENCAVIQSNLESLQLTLSINKPMYVDSKKRRDSITTSLLMYGSSIPFAKIFHFLDFVLQSNLSPAAHLNKIIQQCMQLTNVLRSICGIS